MHLKETMMEPKTRKRIGALLAVLLMGILAVNTAGEVVPCQCSCNGQFIESPVHEDDSAKCPELCGKQCAGFTDCGRAGEDCGSCCSSYCQNAGLPAGGVNACRVSCRDACSFNSIIYELIDVIRVIALVIAAAVFAICGLRILVSEDPESRREAKKCFVYLIFAIVLLGIAQALVGLFYEVPTMPPITTTMPTTSVPTTTPTTTVPTTTIPTTTIGTDLCYDSDGLDYYNKGYRESPKGSNPVWDHCNSVNPSYLYEMECTGDIPGYVYKYCDYGCDDGACRLSSS